LSSVFFTVLVSQAPKANTPTRLIKQMTFFMVCCG
jgi:hypothetical protein